MAQLFKNNAVSTLASQLLVGGTSLTLATGTGSLFPSPTGGDYFLVTLYSLSGSSEVNHEIIKVTARSGDVLTISERGSETTTARQWEIGAPVEMRVTAGAMTSLDVTSSSTTTLTNKTISLANNTVSGTLAQWNTAITDADIQPYDADLAAIAALAGTSGLLKKTAADTWSLDTSTYLTANQSISLGGDASGSGTTSITVTLATVPVTKGGTGATTLTGILKGNGTSAVTAVTAPSGTIVGTTDSQTLTNKTIEAATFTNGYVEESVTANTGTAYTIDLANGSFQILTLTGSCTYTFPTAVAGKSFTLLQKQDVTGSRTVTWPASVKWPSATAPSLTSTLNKADLFAFTSDGTNWYGRVIAQNY